MLYVKMYFLVYLLCISTASVTPATLDVLLQRLTRQETFIESLSKRVERLEVNLRKEEENSGKLQVLVTKLRAEVEESKTRNFTGESYKIPTTIVGQKTTEIIQNDLKNTRQELEANETGELQRDNSLNVACKEHIINTQILMRSFENSIEDLNINVSRLNEFVSGLKMNWTYRSTLEPRQTGGDAPRDKCSRCLHPGADMEQTACQYTVANVYVVEVKNITEDSGMRQIHVDVEATFKKRFRSDLRSRVVLTEPIYCLGCPKFIPGNMYLILAQDRLQDSTQEGIQYEFLLNDRSLYTRYVSFGEHGLTPENRRIAFQLYWFMRTIMDGNWSKSCKKYRG